MLLEIKEQNDANKSIVRKLLDCPFDDLLACASGLLMFSIRGDEYGWMPKTVSQIGMDCGIGVPWTGDPEYSH
jgi:hypothetical protein